MDNKAVEKIDKHFKWIASYPVVATMTPALIKILNSGAFYIGGRDKYYRPAVFMDGEILARMNTETKGGLDCKVFGDLWYFFY